MVKTAEQLFSFNQANMAAFIKSSQIVANGLQSMGSMAAASMQTSIGDAMSTFRAMTSVRSVKEAMDLQASLARASMEKAMADTNRMAETGFKLAGDAFAPLSDRMTTAAIAFKPA